MNGSGALNWQRQRIRVSFRGSSMGLLMLRWNSREGSKCWWPGERNVRTKFVLYRNG